jgi:Trypsin-co-occurring domain 2
MTDTSGLIPLTEWIMALRSDLQQAQQGGIGQQLLFDLGPLELEFELVTTREAGGEDDIRFWVVELSGSGQRAHEATQHVRLTLTPKIISHGPVDAGNERYNIPD